MKAECPKCNTVAVDASAQGAKDKIFAHLTYDHNIHGSELEKLMRQVKVKS